ARRASAGAARQRLPPRLRPQAATAAPARAARRRAATAKECKGKCEVGRRKDEVKAVRLRLILPPSPFSDAGMLSITIRASKRVFSSEGTDGYERQNETGLNRRCGAGHPFGDPLREPSQPLLLRVGDCGRDHRGAPVRQ